MVTGETLLRLAAFAFLCTLVVTHRPAPQVAVVAPFGAGDCALDESTPLPAAAPAPPAVTHAYVNRELVDAIERDPWQMLNPSLVRAFGLDDADIVTKIDRPEQPDLAHCSPTGHEHGGAPPARLLSLSVSRDGHERVHNIYVIE